MDWEEYDIQIARLVFIFFSTISRGGEGYPTIHQNIIASSSTLQIITNSMDRSTFCIVLLVLWAVATGIYFYCQRVKVGDEQDDNTNRQPQQIDNEASIMLHNKKNLRKNDKRRKRGKKGYCKYCKQNKLLIVVLVIVAAKILFLYQMYITHAEKNVIYVWLLSTLAIMSVYNNGNRIVRRELDVDISFIQLV